MYITTIMTVRAPAPGVYDSEASFKKITPNKSYSIGVPRPNKSIEIRNSPVPGPGYYETKFNLNKSSPIVTMKVKYKYFGILLS